MKWMKFWVRLFNIWGEFNFFVFLIYNAMMMIYFLPKYKLVGDVNQVP